MLLTLALKTSSMDVAASNRVPVQTRCYVVAFIIFLDNSQAEKSGKFARPKLCRQVSVKRDY